MQVLQWSRGVEGGEVGVLEGELMLIVDGDEGILRVDGELGVGGVLVVGGLNVARLCAVVVGGAGLMAARFVGSFSNGGGGL